MQIWSEDVGGLGNYRRIFVVCDEVRECIERVFVSAFLDQV